MITANEVKSTLHSLRAKINKETGKEHATIAEGVEDLVLGYGIGQGEAWDGKIYVNGEIAKDVKDYFEEGRQAGLEEAERIIIGTFVLGAKQKPVAEQVVTITDASEVYAYFYNGSTYEKELISSITFSPADELVSIYSLDRTKFLKYIESDGAWSYSNNEINGELPYGDGVIIAFSEQTLVPGNFYKTFMSAVGEEDAYHEGEQAEYDRFWDSFQQNGTRTDYQQAFKGAYWNDNNFRPKYDIAPVDNASQIFNATNVTDVKGICEKQGIKLDFSKVTYISSPFENSKVTRIPILDVRNIPNLTSLFISAKELLWVDGLILNDDGSQQFGSSTGFNWTLYSSKIEHLPITSGVIGTNCYFNSQKELDKESITSIINALSDSTSGLSVTLSKMAVDKAFETSNGANDGSASAEWNALKATKPDWIINLV